MLPIDTARSAYSLVRQSKHEDQVLKLYKSAIRYANLRSEYVLLSIDEKAEMELSRSSAHNSFIDQCNILSRLMAQSDEDNSWRGSLGQDRKVIGDFACYIVLFLSLNAR